MNPIETNEPFPESMESGRAYCLLPREPSESYYRERTDRNIGWITPDEQEMLRGATVGIAGCGGMGGLLASTLCRLGIGEVRIADTEVFDTTNINRQFAAGRYTVGRSKAWETARLMRAVTDDTTLVVYPSGITDATAEPFVAGCDLVCDEVEFWAVGSRIRLHQAARAHGIPVLNCNTVGFGTRLFRFDPDGHTMEALLGLSYDEASLLESRVLAKTATVEETDLVMARMLEGLVPELPEYARDTRAYSTVAKARERLFKEHRATIVSTNPVLAAGFLGNHVLFSLLAGSPIARVLVLPPPAPGYLYFDSGFLEARVVRREARSCDT